MKGQRAGVELLIATAAIPMMAMINGIGTASRYPDSLLPTYAEGLKSMPVIPLLLAPIVLGMFTRTHPVLLGFAMLAVPPMLTIADVALQRGGHNLFPIELGLDFIMAMAAVLLVSLGRLCRKLATVLRPATRNDNRPPTT
jgi:hypothetical protein